MYTYGIVSAAVFLGPNSKSVGAAVLYLLKQKFYIVFLSMTKLWKKAKGGSGLEYQSFNMPVLNIA